MTERAKNGCSYFSFRSVLSCRFVPLDAAFPGLACGCVTPFVSSTSQHEATETHAATAAPLRRGVSGIETDGECNYARRVYM